MTVKKCLQIGLIGILEQTSFEKLLEIIFMHDQSMAFTSLLPLPLGATTFCQLAILSTCHFAYLQCNQLAIISNCHFINLLFYKHVV
jgi:hypothetical protein